MASILRFELRQLRFALLAGAAVLFVLGLLEDVGASHGYAGRDLVGREGAGLLFVVLWMLAAAREWGCARQWEALRPLLPLGPLRVPFVRAALWTLLGLLFAGAFAFFLGPDEAAPLLPRVGLLWAWVVAAGAGLAALDPVRRRRPMAWWDWGLAALLVVLLVGTRDFALEGAGSLAWQGSSYVLGWHHLGSGFASDVLTASLVLAAAFGAVFLLAGARREWFPPASPKPVAVRTAPAGGAPTRRGVVAPPARTLARMAGASDRPLVRIVVFAFATAGVAAIVALGGRTRGTVSALGLLVVGAVLSRRLVRAQRGWAFLRAYPVPPRRYWRPRLGRLTLVVGLGCLLGATVRTIQEVRLVAVREVDLGRGRTWTEVDLRAPPGAAQAAAVAVGRPAPMPPADPRGFWPLRARGAYVFDEAGYFEAALAFYLHRVHGISASTQELRKALGVPVSIEEEVVYLAGRPYVELTRSAFGTRGLDHEAKIPVHTRLSVFERKDAVFYVYADALRRLADALAPRLGRAAVLRVALDVQVWILCLLLFVRLALLGGTLRWVAPAAAALVVALLAEARWAPWWLAVRDAHLAWPLVVPLLFLVVAALLVASIHAALARRDAAAGGSGS